MTTNPCISGLDTEASYPYVARDQKCEFNPKDIGATDTGCVDIPMGNEQKLKEAVASVGPVSVAIDASNFSFQFYHSGNLKITHNLRYSNKNISENIQEIIWSSLLLPRNLRGARLQSRLA